MVVGAEHGVGAGMGGRGRSWKVVGSTVLVTGGGDLGMLEVELAGLCLEYLLDLTCGLGVGSLVSPIGKLGVGRSVISGGEDCVESPILGDMGRCKGVPLPKGISEC